jgi:hypothetical protein
VIERRIRRHHLPDDEPVEQHPNTGQMLQLSACPCSSGHMNRPNTSECVNPLPFTPEEEVSRGPRIDRPRVLVADVHGEVFEVAQRGPIPGTGDERGKRRARRATDVEIGKKRLSRFTRTLHFTF